MVQSLRNLGGRRLLATNLEFNDATSGAFYDNLSSLPGLTMGTSVHHSRIHLCFPPSQQCGVPFFYFYFSFYFSFFFFFFFFGSAAQVYMALQLALMANTVVMQVKEKYSKHKGSHPSKCVIRSKSGSTTLLLSRSL